LPEFAMAPSYVRNDILSRNTTLIALILARQHHR
jgi:hypothetical protein